jgi:hypothetical protein
MHVGKMLTLSLPGSAVDGPVVIAVLVDVALSVEEESIFAVLEGERAVGALEEVVAQLRVGVGLHAMLFGAVRSGSSKHYEEETKKISLSDFAQQIFTIS